MIDLHSHLLPGVDDGSRSVQQSVGVLEDLARHGVTDLCLTPHATASKVDQGVPEDHDRAYEALADVPLQPSVPWTPIDVDLSAYAGRKLSIFYRPDRVLWHFILNADAVGGAPGSIAWGDPEIVAPGHDVREYVERKAELSRPAR